MEKEIPSYIKLCETCQLNAYKRQKMNHALLPFLDQVSSPFELVAIDGIGPFLLSSNGNRFALVLIDYFTKWCEVKAIRSLNAAETIEFLTEVMNRHGVPKKFLSD